MLRRGSSKKKEAKKPNLKKEKKPKLAKTPKPKREGVVVAKRENDIYTVLLLLSLVANIVAIALLYFELGSGDYGDFPWWK